MKRVIKKWLVIFLLLIAALGCILGLFYYTNTRASKKIIESGEPQVVNLQKQIIARDFKSIISDVLILSQSQMLRKVLDGYDEAKDEVAKRYLIFSERRRSFDQVRYLDEAGMEIVRVDFNDGNPRRISEEKLQAKGDRYYFRDAFALEKGEIFVSPLDLNIERGEIERPAKEKAGLRDSSFNDIWILVKDKKYAKPMIRFATPVFDSRGQKKGIVLVNFFGTQLIKVFDEIALNSLGKCFLINRKGFWLKGPNPEVEWGFMREHDKEQIYENTFPDAWKRVSKEESGQFHTADGLFTFTTIYPLEEGLKTSTGSGKAFETSAKRLEAKDYAWKIVSFVPREVFISRTRGTLQGFFLLYIVLVILTAIGFWFWASISIRNKEAQERERQLILEVVDVEKKRIEGLVSLNEELESANEKLKKAKEELELTKQWLEEQVKKRTKELEKEKNSLEIKVVKRTKELEASKISLEGKVKKRTKELEESKELLEVKVQERTGELENKMKDLKIMNELMIGRELKMIDLKKEIHVMSKEWKKLNLDNG